ncbi:MAG: hypothetical protein ACRDRH_07195 [Pseudonocardia sp.]
MCASAATATTLLGAAPAYAATPVTVNAVLGTMGITGTAFGDIITVAGGNGTVTVSSPSAVLKAEFGCTQLGSTVRCTGVGLIEFTGLDGDDKFTNNTSTRSSQFAGFGNDRLIGGSGNDRLAGGPGTDVANGGAGVDSCTAETKTSCEKS